ncbi:MAG TPA: YncE family protein [Terriglobales bacterium]|nr:YncE family protein [Terriglobales bacterium]
MKPSHFLGLGLSVCVFGALALAATPAPRPQAAGPLGYHVSKSVPLPGVGFWDYLAEDPANRRLYVDHGDEVLVLNLDTQQLVGTITGLHGTHGTAISDKDGHGFITNGGSATITEFDIKTLKKLKEIPAPKDVDGIIYDPATDRVFAFCGDANQAIAVNAKTGEAVGTIDLGGAPEFGASDGKGFVFNVLENKSMILKIDAHSLKIVGRYPLAPCKGPSGVSIDAAHERVFAGCHSGVVAIVNGDTGAVIATPKIGQGIDASRFDAGTQLLFTSQGDGTITVIHEDSPDQFTELGNIPTERGARTMAVDPKTHTLFTVTAKFEPMPAPTPGQRRRRPTMVPGSFHLLVVKK